MLLLQGREKKTEKEESWSRNKHIRNREWELGNKELRRLGEKNLTKLPSLWNQLTEGFRARILQGKRRPSSSIRLIENQNIRTNSPTCL